MPDVKVDSVASNVHAAQNPENGRGLWCLPVLLALAVTAPVAAQTGTLIEGHRSQSSMVGEDFDLPTEYKVGKPEVQPTDAALAAGRDMARCVWRRRPEGATALLSASDLRAFSAGWKTINALVEDCSIKQTGGTIKVNSMSMPNATVRGLLAEAGFERNGMPALVPVDYAAVTTGSDWITTDGAMKVVLRTSDCLAARQPQDVAKLLSTIPGSSAEARSFAPITGALGACLEKGVMMSARLATLRLALASALDRRMRTASVR